MNAKRGADGRQQDVAARLVRLGLDGEPNVVAVVDRVLRQHVDALGVARERRPDVLGRVGLGAFAPTPEHVGLRAEFDGKVEVAHDLAQCVAANRAVVAGEATVLEHRVGEQVGGRHRHDEASFGERVLEPSDVLLAIRVTAPERDQVIVVERHTVSTELGEPVHGLDRVEGGPGRVAERVARLPAHSPEPEGEAVLRRRAQ